WNYEHQQLAVSLAVFDIDDETVRDLIQLLHRGIDIGGAHAQTMAIDGRIASASDRATAIGIDPQPVAVSPDSRPLCKVRSSVPTAVRIVPEVQRHARKRTRTYQLSDLLDDSAPLLVPGFDGGAKMAALKP